MQKRFNISTEPLAQLLAWAESGHLQLPDFQRSWVWDDHHIRSLLASISLSYPIGALMTLAAGNPGVSFKSRLLEGVPENGSPSPSVLLLDGQQRLTALFQALKSRVPVNTRDRWGKSIRRHYYAVIDACVDPSRDREEEGLISVPEDRVLRSDFGRQIDRDLRTAEQETEVGWFPLDIVLDDERTMDWQMEYIRPDRPDSAERYRKWKKFQAAIVRPFSQYLVPTIELAKETPKEAVCQVFEKVNTGGVTLTVFELLTATYAADNFDLRRDWEERFGRLKEKHPLLAGLENTGFLQTVTLLATFAARRSHAERNRPDETAPAVSCRRRDILRLPVDHYRTWADVAERGLREAAAFLTSQAIYRHRDLPYATQLVPLAAILGRLGPRAGAHTARLRLEKWFWCGVLGEMYAGTTETRFAQDIEDCVPWIAAQNGASAPRTVAAAQFQAERLLTLKTRNSAAYKGLHALSMKRGSRDLMSGEPIDFKTYDDRAIDIHHIFPKAWIRKQEDIDDAYADCIVNKTAIAAYTNRVIGGSAPSEYLSRLERERVAPENLDRFLRSHDIDPGTLRRDDFPRFFDGRFEALLRLVEGAMGKPVNRSAERDESPFRGAAGDIEQEIRFLLEAGESRIVEFKSTARLNLHSGKKDEAIEWAVVKTVAAFMNTKGGALLIGVDDQGTPVGIEQDYPFVPKRNRDGWDLKVGEILRNALGRAEALRLSLRYAEIDGRTVARVRVGPADGPVFATRKGHPLAFYARQGNATVRLAGPELLSYREQHWG